MEEEAFQAMLPTNAPVRIRNPCLVRDEERPPDEEQRPEGPERNVVLQKDIAPAEMAQEFERAGPANDFKREIAVAGGLGDDAHFVTQLDKFARE